MPDTPAPESASERWQKRIKGAAVPKDAPANTSKDVLAIMRDIFGDGVRDAFGMRREGKEVKKIKTIEIDSLCLDVAAINAWNLARRINQYAEMGELPIAVVGGYEGVAFHLSLDADTANKMLDVVPAGDPPPHPPTLRGYLNILAMEMNPPENVTTITGFTPRGR